MPDLHRSPLFVAVLLVAAPACGPSESGDEVGDEVGETGDGDGDLGDGDGDGGDGDGDDEFGALCELGCAYFIDCAPAEFAELYADPIECRAACVALYGACVPEATAYFECFVELSCADVVVASTEGPAATACGPSFATAQAACGL